MQTSRIRYYIRHLEDLSKTTESQAVADKAEQAIALFDSALDAHSKSEDFYIESTIAHSSEVSDHYEALLNESIKQFHSLCQQGLQIYINVYKG